MKFKPTASEKVKSFLVFLLFATTFIAQSAQAQKVQAKPISDLSLEDELAKEPAQPTKTASTTTVYGYDQQHALKGFSFGGVFFNQNFNSSVALVVDGTDRRVASKSADFQFLGGIIRYTEFPYNKIGTDISLSMATSVNHDNVGYKPLMSTKIEINFGYAWQTLARSSVYLLGGLGYENVRGRDIEMLIGPGGTSLQIGGGMNYSKTITIEGIFSLSKHAVGENLLNSLVSIAEGQGYTASYDYSKSTIFSNQITGRLIYQF